MLYYSKFAKGVGEKKKIDTIITIYVTCAFIFIMLLFVKQKVQKTLSIKCTIQFVNTVNKIHFYVWSIDSVCLMYVTLKLNTGEVQYR